MQYSTIDDIAKRVNKSVATVSRVLNGKEKQGIPISVRTRDLILKTARELHYRPNILARNLVQGDSKVIGFVVPDIMQSYFNEICYFMNSRLNEAGYDMVLAHSYENPGTERHAIEMLLSRRVSGIIISPAAGVENCAFLDGIQSDTPMILLDRYFPGKNFNVVSTDDVTGCGLLTDHLVSRGARRIIFIAGNRDTSVTIERIRGYKNVMARHGIPFEESRIIDSGYFMEDGYAAAKGCVKNGMVGSADAIMGVNDAVALGVLKALDEERIRVPDALMVAGYSNDRYSEFFNVPLTTVRQPKDRIADKAVGMLMDLLAGGNISDRHLKVPCDLIVRKSTMGAGEDDDG
jgi:LacI family transcriptional regulator